MQLAFIAEKNLMIHLTVSKIYSMFYTRERSKAWFTSLKQSAFISVF